MDVAVVAKRNLYMGIPITKRTSPCALSPEMVPADVVFTSIEAVLQRTPKERVLVNEIVRSERLARREAGIGLNAIITPGKRAVSVAIAAEEAVAGFIQPLNYVDGRRRHPPRRLASTAPTPSPRRSCSRSRCSPWARLWAAPMKAETAEAGKPRSVTPRAWSRANAPSPWRSPRGGGVHRLGLGEGEIVLSSAPTSTSSRCRPTA
ncbi:MAG: hypothetical protein IPI35_15250 [Deltaproteobacteria bacterium]|nr:hypothetical protein [Deltaproteobacteria bacterium]